MCKAVAGVLEADRVQCSWEKQSRLDGGFRVGAGECMCASVDVFRMVVTMMLGIVCDVYIVIEMTEKMTQRSNYDESCMQIKIYDFYMTFIYE